MLKSIELEEARNILKSKIFHLGTETVNITDCHERILSEDIFSPIDQPPFNRSPLDGYAFKAEDSKGASKTNGVKLKVLQEIFAGYHTETEITQGTAIRLMTGAPIPKGANCVIRQESTNFDNGFVEIFTELSPWENVCFQGEDIKKGKLILKKGAVLKYAEIAVLSSMGYKDIPVYKLPKVGILSTGDEVISLGEELSPGKIYNSNLYCLYARLKEFHCEPIIMGIVNDDKNKLQQKIKESLSKSDILITTGGVSVGKKDLMKDVMKDMGADLLFWKVAIKPGSPVFCSSLNNKLVISLSGNPAAAITTFEILVRPILAEITKREDLKLHKIPAILQQDFNKKSTVRRFIRGHFYYTNSGAVVDLTQVTQGNGILTSTLNSNCLIDIPAHSPFLHEGEIVQIILL